ncbi:MAG: bifunctional diaminohydroxyphosphoribosylaminopyrimidine deaminase/5-amino-6-(5-phosphoribosylamino)uracil reductase RibD [Oscillospiraceae bacterium]|nr:bifunctional diaminohydroxyphosphoribosylaminopyrimidine deaminase/5-amino-6-(5-phosphoribosylamino)uracil reductase RibD [Oscillospiraceae bacterium]
MTHEEYMQRAITLAENGIGFVNPNPLVGAVIVKDGRIIGEGWHHAYGEAHAERNALAACTEDPTGADLYVTLEPCCHEGKNPPCTQAVIEAGIRRVFVGSDDPNPLVNGGGTQALRDAGIEVVTGVCKAECDALNPIFFHYITTKMPYVLMKIAMTADGKTATRAGYSKWITGEEARARVHETRKRLAAIMIGIGTVLADDPTLTCRTENPSNPVRVICDTNLQIPLDCKLVRTAHEVPTYVAASRVDKRKAEHLEKSGVHILEVPSEDGHVNLRSLMRKLGALGLDSVLLEGGAALHEAALRAGIVQRLHVYIAPKIFGGVSAKSAVGGLGVSEVEEAYRLSMPEISRCGEDVLLRFDVLEAPDVHGDH